MKSSVFEDQSTRSQSDEAQGHGGELRGPCPSLSFKTVWPWPKTLWPQVKKSLKYIFSNILFLNKNPTCWTDTEVCVCVLEYNGSRPFWFACWASILKSESVIHSVLSDSLLL